MKIALPVLFLIAWAFGAKVPLEKNVIQSTSLRLASTLGAQERIGQSAFLGVLGGFRSVVADFLFIDAHFAWERTDWPYLLMRMRQVTMLQPHMMMFWDIAAWHMAWNAGTAALNDPHRSPFGRRRLQHEYLELGRDFLERGIANNPDQAPLYEAMARLYRDKYQDHARAGEFFLKAAPLKDAAPFDERFAAYELSFVPGREREAYQLLHQLYLRGERQHLPTLLARIRALENQLNIPPSERIPPNEK